MPIISACLLCNENETTPEIKPKFFYFLIFSRKKKYNRTITITNRVLTYDCYIIFRKLHQFIPYILKVQITGKQIKHRSEIQKQIHYSFDAIIKSNDRFNFKSTI